MELRPPIGTTMGLQGYRVYPTLDGRSNLIDFDGASGGAGLAHFALDLGKSCPVDENNEDWGAAASNPLWRALSRTRCRSPSLEAGGGAGANPFSPKCRGKSCGSVSIGTGGLIGADYLLIPRLL